MSADVRAVRIRSAAGPGRGWWGGTGLPAAGSTTARDLALRRAVLLGLTATITVALFFSYRGVHGDADPLRTASAPAVLAVDTAEFALAQAQTEASSGGSANSDFQKQISVAAQSLAAAAADNVTGLAGRQSLQTVAGLITVYTGLVQTAQLQEPDSLLREAYLGYANDVLVAPDSGIRPRLELLQQAQRSVVARQTSFGWELWCGWSLAVLLLAALAAALLETQIFLRRRFRRRWNRELLAAEVLLAAGCLTLVLFTLWTHRGMADARGLLAAEVPGERIGATGRQIAADLADTGFRAAATGWIVIGGVLLMALAELGLRPRVDDYRFRPQ